jgi:hypothetical protein
MSNYDPRSLLATAPMSSVQILVCTITVFLNALDGFDLLAISFATPGIMKEFNIPPNVGLGLVLSMDLWSRRLRRPAPRHPRLPGGHVDWHVPVLACGQP